MTSSKILLWLSVSFIAGVFVASLVAVEQWLFGELFLLGFFHIAVFRQTKTIVVLGCCLVVFSFGLWRTNLAFNEAPNQPSEVSPRRVGFQEWRLKLNKVIDENLTSPGDDILTGILWGAQSQLSYEWKQKLNSSGVRHITAVSGMNIVLLAGMLTWLGIVLGLWRQQAIAASLVFIWLYIVFIGWPASAVRAGVMASVFLVARALGRQCDAGRVIFLAAALMLFVNPLALLRDWGFQLSFLATLGLIYGAPFFQRVLAKLAILRTLGFNELLAMTLAAQIFTWPLLVFNFGQVSLVAPLTNLLVAFCVPVLMVLGFLLTLAGLVWPSLAAVLAFLCQLLMGYFVTVIDWCSRVPLASVKLFISWPALALSYLALGLWVFRLKQAEHNRRLP